MKCRLSAAGAGALVAAIAGILWGCAPGAPAAPAKPASPDAPGNPPAQVAPVDPGPRPAPDGPVGPVRTELPKYVEGKLAPDAAVTLRYRTDVPRRLVYVGALDENMVARTGEDSSTAVSALRWQVSRRHVVLGVGQGLPAEMGSVSTEELAAASQAGRDVLAELRDRPSGGRRVFAGSRRVGARGVEPLAVDRLPEQRLESFPELPRLPAAQLTAGGVVEELAAGCRIEWRLVGSGTFGGRRCWRITRQVLPAAPGENLDCHDEFIFDEAGSTVLRSVRGFSTPSGGMVRMRNSSFLLTDDSALPADEARAALDESAKTARLLTRIGERMPDEASAAAAELAAARVSTPAIDFARRFAAGEKALLEPAGGARRVDLVPEDTYVLLWAPKDPKPGQKLTPVVFFHGAGAGPKRYFDDWTKKVGDRPLLLVFPQSRDWTWRLDRDTAVVGSLLERLGQTYPLDRERLVLAGHGTGAELAFALAYTAEFPGYRVRGVVAAGGTMTEKDQNMKRLRTAASDGKHEALAARVRAIDVLAMAGEADKLYPLKDFRNVDAWLRSFNPDGVALVLTPGLGQQYSTDWTPQILEWVGKLKSAGGAGQKGADSR